MERILRLWIGEFPVLEVLEILELALLSLSELYLQARLHDPRVKFLLFVIRLGLKLLQVWIKSQEGGESED
jgi:hypothetical protein